MNSIICHLVHTSLDCLYMQHHASIFCRALYIFVNMQILFSFVVHSNALDYCLISSCVAYCMCPTNIHIKYLSTYSCRYNLRATSYLCVRIAFSVTFISFSKCRDHFFSSFCYMRDFRNISFSMSLYFVSLYSQAA